VEHVCDTLYVSQRRACRVLDQHRSTQCHHYNICDEEELLTARIIALATTYGRYGYRMITGLLRNEGWKVNHKRVERIWRKEGLKLPKKQPKRGRLWLNDGSCIRLRPEYKNHVWSYDFMTEKTHDGILNILDEYTKECLDITVERKITSHRVIERLAHLFITKGIPEHIRSDNGPEFTAKEIRKWLTNLGVNTLFIEPGSPWENGHIESFNGKLRDELLDREIFTTLLEAKVLIGNWRREYNTIRPHSSLGYKPPAPETIMPNNGYFIEGLTLKVVQ
jgi:putative transposase